MNIEKDDAIFDKIYECFRAHDNMVKYGELVDYVAQYFEKDDVIEWIKDCPYIYSTSYQVKTLENDTELTSEWIM